MRLRSSTITLTTILALTALSACKKEEPLPQSYDSRAAPQNKFGFREALDGDAEAPPPAKAIAAPTGIDVTAAPGVAFRYGYAFVLPDKAISTVQEQHAAACEKLGPTQCRITGMHYRLVQEDRVQADLQFKLSPALARQFGKDGIAAVEKAEGKLVEAAIEGRDVATGIVNSQSRSDSLEARLKQVEGQLASGGISSGRRDSLTSEAASLRRELEAEKQTRSDGAEQLANTPMTFNYTGNTDFAFGESPFGDAWDSTVNSGRTMIASVLLVVGTVLPWALLALLLLILWRTPPVRALRRFVRGAVPSPAVLPPPPAETDT